MIYAVTILPPWPDLILSGEKRYEFRRWAPTSETIALGDRCAIHEPGRGIVGVAKLGPVWISREHWDAFGIFDQPGAPGLRDFCMAMDARPFKAWRLNNVRDFAPIPCPGKQGPWPLPPDVEMAVIERMAT